MHQWRLAVEIVQADALPTLYNFFQRQAASTIPCTLTQHLRTYKRCPYYFRVYTACGRTTGSMIASLTNGQYKKKKRLLDSLIIVFYHFFSLFCLSLCLSLSAKTCPLERASLSRL